MKLLQKIYNSHATTIISMLLGIYVGINHKEFSQNFSPIGEIYIKLLMISVLPIVIFSLLTAVYQIITSGKSILMRSFIISIIMLTLGLIFVLVLTFYIKPWIYIKDITDFNTLFAGDTSLRNFEKNIEDNYEENIDASFLSLIMKAIPTNIFGAMNTGNMLQIIVASLIVGYAITVTSQKNNSINKLRSTLDYWSEVFMNINNFFTSLMPVGVFFLMTSQFVAIDLNALKTLGILTEVICGCIFFQIIVYFAIIKVRSKSSFLEVIKSFLETIIIIITTRSSIIALPKAMTAMTNLKYSSSVVNAFLPFGISVIRIGTMSFFAIVTFFIMGIFDVEITLFKSIFIIFACILSSISTIGTSGIITLQMISIVLDPLGLPLGGVLAILIAIDAVVDVFDTCANVIGNCAIAALIDEKK
jgi:proton glutamate symport protein